MTGGCISLAWRCDKDIDCVDGSDEGGCTEGKSACQEGEFRCEDGFCINLDWKCDGDADCDDHSDERDCPPRQCAAHEFQCLSGKCIQLEWRCDGDFDCSDNSDEDGCAGREVACDPGHFRCLDGTCIVERLVCNGTPDCPDRSDEAQNTTCNVDECTYEGTCSQSCVNTVPSFQCLCKEGYRLRDDKRHCKAQGSEAYMIFANGADIRRITMDKSEYTSVAAKLQNAVALDYHLALDLLFWSDITVDVIRACSLSNCSGEGSVRTLVSRGLGNPDGLAVDWVMGRVYWTDSGLGRVESVGVDGRHRRALVWKDLDKPRAIVVYPQFSSVFWTDWGARPRIERIFSDGSGRRAIADTSLFWPNGLTIDYASDRIFWADAKHHQIESADLDGANRKKVIEAGLPHPFAVTIFEDTLYWTDWQTKSIHTATKFGQHEPSIFHPKLSFPMDIKVVQSLRQPDGPNACTLSDIKCSHICVSNNETASCACPSGLDLQADGLSCVEKPDSFLLFAHRGDIRRLCLNCSYDVDVTLPLRSAISAVDLDWDAVTDTIFWTDVTHHAILKVKWNGEGQEVVVGTNAESVAGLALDWVNRKLYWTDAANDRIEVANLDGSHRAVLIYDGLDKPRGIVVDPIRGHMYWTDLGDLPKIERASMAGQQRSVIVQHNLTWPNALAMDYATETLYWTDGATKTIELIHIATMKRKVLMSHDLPHPFGLTVFDGRVYWTDWDKKAILSADAATGENRRTVLPGRDNLRNILVFHRNRPSVPNACSSNNGGCSHLCLIAPKPKSFLCACPTGTMLLNDTKTCSKGMRRFLIFSRRTEIRKMSLDVPYWADVVVPLRNLRNVVAVDVDTADEQIYYADAERHVVQSCDIDGRQAKDVISFGLETLGGLAVDTIGRKLYWTDSGRSLIEVSELDGRHRHVLVWKDVDSPRAVVLHYEKGAMFWTDWGNKIRIESADMDGENRALLVQDGLGWPHGLTIDKESSRLVWADAKLHVIESSGLDGKNRKVLAQDVAHPYGVLAFLGKLYWTDWETKAVHRADASGQDGHVIRANLAGLMDIHAVNMEQSGISVCGKTNGGCSHLCLRKPHGFSCACPTGVLLKPDGRACNDAPSAFLLFANRGSLRQISLDTPDSTDMHLPLSNVYNAVAVDFNYDEWKLYYTDVTLDVIRKVDLNGSNVEVIIDTDLEAADGLALDWIARNIYWADSRRKTIEVARADGSSRKLLINLDLDEPRALALFPEKGFIFWSDWGKLPKIERSFLDGSARRVIIATDLGWPNGLAIDYEMERLYWVDAQLDCIEFSDLNGKNRQKLIEGVSHPFGLTQYESYIYWTDWHTKAIEKAHKETGAERVVIRDNIEYLMEIKMVARSRQTGANSCSVRNGGCSHLCLYRPQGHICACPSHPDSRHCSTFPDMTTPSEVPPISTPLPSAQPNASTAGCSSSDMAGGRCHVIGFKFHDPMFQSTYIALSVVGGALVLLLLGALLIWCKKSRNNRTLERGGPAPHMARYSNHSPGPADYLDKKPWGWSPKVRYDNHHEAGLVGLGGKEKLDNLEVAALVSKRLDELESGMLTLSSAGGGADAKGGGGGGGLYSLGLQGCPTPPSPPRVACPRHSPHSMRGGSLRRTLPHDMHQQPQPVLHHHHHHLPSVETDI
ncbi:hypothetical protein V5799_026062 [Amblyomma americanum]|uniref:EGF-like domain-containing protein n=1 Tax=Amblyomma americanum TaxID=6943 RepID=A0AAQ4DJN4_AMBAM